MTCILIGKDKENNCLVIGGDRQATWGDIYFQAPTKIYKKGELILGYAGSYKYGTILSSLIMEFEPENDTIDFLMLQKSIAELAKDYKVKDDEDLEGIEILMGYKNHIYLLTDNLHFIEISEDYFSIGSGSGFAMGCLWAIKKIPNSLSTQEIFELCLACASSHSVSVGKPFDIVSSEPKKQKEKKNPRKPLEDLVLLVE